MPKTGRANICPLTAWGCRECDCLRVNGIYLVGCTRRYQWSWKANRYLAHYADYYGTPVDNVYSDLNEAKLVCIRLKNGCGGVTYNGGSGGYTLRLGTSFRQSPSGEHSYLKPSNPCEGKYSLITYTIYIYHIAYYIYIKFMI